MSTEKSQLAQRCVKSQKVRRDRSGCRSCRRRGKKCDEAKPICQACIRLGLECRYGVDFAFRNYDRESFIQGGPSSRPDRATSRRGLCASPICTSIESGEIIKTRYLDHFISHVRHLLPASPFHFTHLQRTLQSPQLRSAALCISASNLSMLSTQVQRRCVPSDSRRSVSSPVVNQLHHAQARKYQEQTLSHCRNVIALNMESEAPAILTALTVLAYYHHASTDHRRFRLTVWDTVRFVSNHREVLTRSADGNQALQMWYRLCVSHRLGKPPAMLLEGEGRSVHGPNLYPGSLEELYLHCITGLSLDDLIYDILIKTTEIRSRIMVFRCVAGWYGLSDEAWEIGGVAHGLLTRYLGRDDNEAESAETQSGYMRGVHLRGLLHVQRERLAVWTSHLSVSKGQSPGPASLIPTRIRTHRDAMNALYSLLCETMFDEAEAETTVETPTSSSHSYAQKFIHILSTLDLAASITSDIYTFSLTEVLLQLVQCCKSPSLFTYILDTFWPLLETKGRGYEHSHYPTHLVKRIIGLIAAYWAQGREIKLVLPAVSEDVPKMRLLDIYSEIRVVVCGWDGQGEREGKGESCFLESVRLP
ncbi:Zn(II)2Cys6 transcription factor [Aspergillus foveolatus]|uniref:Zn(II)2Cys6 transcription factor n=1 Tax=Aspergillus foveolatus TaxID=210207 RepID=UPI003CCDA529